MENRPRRASGRRRRRPSRLQRMIYRYFPSICLVALSIVCVSAVISTVKTISTTLNSPRDPIHMESPSSTPTESTNALTQEQINQLLQQADKLAGGYDYLGAIELLQSAGENDTFAAKIAEYTQLDSQLVTYSDLDNVTHIFFHSLIVDPVRAFDGDEDQDGYNLYMVTVKEFKAILQQMYDRGYVLVSPYDIAYETTDALGNTSFVYGNIRLPEAALCNDEETAFFRTFL